MRRFFQKLLEWLDPNEIFVAWFLRALAGAGSPDLRHAVSDVDIAKE